MVDPLQIHPDDKWYIEESSKLQVPPYCPYASLLKCPLYFKSYSKLITVINEFIPHYQMSSDEIIKLTGAWMKQYIEFWRKTDKRPPILELRQKKGILFCMNFCPEVSYRHIGFYVSAAFESQMSDKEKVEKSIPRDHWRWDYALIEPLHYYSCSMHLFLKQKDKSSSPVKLDIATQELNHSSNYHWIKTKGGQFELSDPQAEVIKKLYEQWKLGVKKLTTAEIFSDYSSDNKLPRIRDRFRTKNESCEPIMTDAWGKLIMTDNNGRFWLNL